MWGAIRPNLSRRSQRAQSTANDSGLAAVLRVLGDLCEIPSFRLPTGIYVSFSSPVSN